MALCDERIVNGETPTEKDIAIMNLRSLLWRTEGQDKCTICNAIRHLEKKEQPQNSAWPLAAMLMFWVATGPNGGMFNDEAFLKAFSETLEKYNKEKEHGEKAGENNSRSQTST